MFNVDNIEVPSVSNIQSLNVHKFAASKIPEIVMEAVSNVKSIIPVQIPTIATAGT